jgi:hypothetical protein
MGAPATDPDASRTTLDRSTRRRGDDAAAVPADDDDR